MKIVINSAYGGFLVPDEVCERTGLEPYDSDRRTRKNEYLIYWVEQHPESDLKVAELDDDITDYLINEYDGWETIFYVKNGKIYEIEWDPLGNYWDKKVGFLRGEE